MNRLLFAVGFLAAASAPAWAVPVSYNTTGSTLVCAGVVGCIQNTATSITDGGITLTYNAGSGSNVLTDSFISFGNLVTTGTGSADFRGAELFINVNATPPGASGALPFGMIGGFGNISTNSSLEFMQFGPANTTSTLGGTMPGVMIGSLLFQVYQPGLYDYGLQAPTVGNPVGETTITGVVSSVVTAVPEPETYAMLLAGLAVLPLLRGRSRKAD